MTNDRLNYKQIMAIYGKSAETVRRWMRGECFGGDELLRHIDENGKQYVLASDVEAFAERNGLKPVDKTG